MFSDFDQKYLGFYKLLKHFLGKTLVKAKLSVIAEIKAQGLTRVKLYDKILLLLKKITQIPLINSLSTRLTKA